MSIPQYPRYTWDHEWPAVEEGIAGALPADAYAAHCAHTQGARR